MSEVCSMMAQSSVDSDRLSSAGLSTHSSGTVGNVGGSVVGVRIGDQKREDEYNLGPLPPMWEKAFTPSGEVYFIDHNSGTSHWLDPRLARVRKHSLGECGEDELPYGWERVTDERYGSYYVDHINRRTQYENPVLQARRMRENPGVNQQNGSTPVPDLHGERFTITLTKGTQGLGFTLIGAEGIAETEGYLQIRSIVPHSPAWIDGALRPGDVLVGVGQRGVRGLSHAQVAQMFQSIPAGAPAVLHLVRGYPLSFDSEDPNTRVLSTLAVDSNATSQPDAVAMQQLTRALRTRFNLESPNRGDSNQSRDETDTSPGTPHSPSQRRLMSRSFDLDELTTNNEETAVPPRCPSADHLLTLASDPSANKSVNSGTGRELTLSLRRGNAGFGFTIADSVHGQKVKKVLDRSRCAGLREGDLLLQIGEHDVSSAPHSHVVQVLKECPAMRETILRVWRRNPHSRATRSRSATRMPTANLATPTLSRSKTPTAEQLRSNTLHAHELEHDLHDRLNGMNGMNSEATYAIPEQKQRPLLERRLGNDNSVSPLDACRQPKWDENSNHNNWEQSQSHAGLDTPTVRVDAGYWQTSNLADSDNGGFLEDGMLHSPTTAAISGMNINSHRQSPASNRLRAHSPANSGHLGSPSPSSGRADHRLGSPASRMRHSPDNSCSDRLQDPMRLRQESPSLRLSRRSPCYDNDSLQQQQYNGNYQQDGPSIAPGGILDPAADVLVRISRGACGFGFRIVGGTEDGTTLCVGRVVPGGPADGLLRPGDLLTSVDGIPLLGASHAHAVAYVCQAAPRGHVTLGVRHNRADIQPLGLPPMSAQHSHQHQPLMTSEGPLHLGGGQTQYNIVHPAPLYPNNMHNHHPHNMYGGQYGMAHWQAAPCDVTVPRNDGEGFGFVVISSTNKATSTIGQLIPNSPAARCGLLHVGDTILAINQQPIRNLPHPAVVGLIKQSGNSVTLTVVRDSGE